MVMATDSMRPIQNFRTLKYETPESHLYNVHTRWFCNGWFFSHWAKMMIRWAVVDGKESPLTITPILFSSGSIMQKKLSQKSLSVCLIFMIISQVKTMLDISFALSNLKGIMTNRWEKSSLSLTNSPAIDFNVTFICTRLHMTTLLLSQSWKLFWFLSWTQSSTPGSPKIFSYGPHYWLLSAPQTTCTRN